MHSPALRTVVIAALLTLSSGASATPTIQALVDQVNQANIVTHVTTLAAAPRDDPADWTSAATYIENELISYGYTTSRRAVGSGEGPADNISAVLTGTTTPDEVFIVGAHYDTVDSSPGADDNASGVAVMLEIARVLAGTPRPWTIEFVAYAHEEKGLFGSLAHVSDAVSAGTDIVGMVSLEMVGYTCPSCQFPFPDIPGCFDVSAPSVTNGNFVGAVVNDASANLAVAFEVATSIYSPDLLPGTAQVAANGACLADTRRSDHSPYWDNGFQAMMLTDTANFRNPNYHDPTDTIATINFDFAEAIARATLGLAATLYTPVEVPVAAKKLVVVDKPGKTSKLVFIAKDAAVEKGAAGSLDLLDASLAVFYTDAPVDVLGVLTIPAPWDKNDDKIAKYKNKEAPSAGAVKVGILKNGKLGKVVAKGLGDGRVLDTVSGAAPGSQGVTTILTVANENDDTVRRYCTRFSTADGSTITYKEIAGGTGRKLIAKDGVGVACP